MYFSMSSRSKTGKSSTNVGTGRRIGDFFFFDEFGGAGGEPRVVRYGSILFNNSEALLLTFPYLCERDSRRMSRALDSATKKWACPESVDTSK